jgi:hypothetical protein
MWGSSVVGWLARQGYPPGYRVLCHNCNSAYGYYGHCPHQQATEKVADCNYAKVMVAVAVQD